MSGAGDGAAGDAGDGARYRGRLPRRLLVLLQVLAATMAARFVATWRLSEEWTPRSIEWPQFLEELKAGDIEYVTVSGRKYAGKRMPGREFDLFTTAGPAIDSEPNLRALIEKPTTLVVEE